MPPQVEGRHPSFVRQNAITSDINGPSRPSHFVDAYPCRKQFITCVEPWNSSFTTALCSDRPTTSACPYSSRAPPLLKLRLIDPISERLEVCRVRQLYIRSIQVCSEEAEAVKPWMVHCVNDYVCAICLIFNCIFLQNAENQKSSPKLFLFRSAASSLTVTLPNMDRVMGGECA